MLILAADTSLPLLSVALLRDDALIGAVTLEGKGSRNEKLLPAIDWLLSESGSDRKEIELFAVTRGPGSFTGVRIGLATMQGLAMAVGRPLCAMSTDEAIGCRQGRTTVVDEAGRGEYYVSQFSGESEVVAPRLASAAERDALSAGTNVVVLTEFLRSGNAAVACARRAGAIASRGALDAYTDITPIYVRLAEAEVKLQQKQNA